MAPLTITSIAVAVMMTALFFIAFSVRKVDRPNPRPTHASSLVPRLTDALRAKKLTHPVQTLSFQFVRLYNLHGAGETNPNRDAVTNPVSPIGAVSSLTTNTPNRTPSRDQMGAGLIPI